MSTALFFLIQAHSLPLLVCRLHLYSSHHLCSPLSKLLTMYLLQLFRLTTLLSLAAAAPQLDTATSSSILSSVSLTMSRTSVSITPSPTTLSSTVVHSGTACTCTEYSQIAPAVASCTSIVLQNINAPTNSSIDLTKILAGTTVTFAGTTVSQILLKDVWR